MVDGHVSDNLTPPFFNNWPRVANGVRSFKSKQYDDALKHFNHALDIDAENVEALVARGAL